MGNVLAKEPYYSHSQSPVEKYAEIVYRPSGGKIIRKMGYG